MNIHTLSLVDILRLFHRRELSPLEYSEACLQRVDRLESTIHAFITLTPERALERARLASTSKDESFTGLQGVPLAVKDLFETAGIRTTAGSRFFSDYVPSSDAAVVSRLLTAGVGLLGKLNMHEIALGVTTANPHYGVCRNPWDFNRSPGGSSGGSAAALAAGFCPVALGTDTGGSIRIPASLCGVVGLKPTFGRISLRGVIPLSWNLDHAGPMARTVRDTALLLQFMAGFDSDDSFSMDVPVGDYLVDIQAGISGWRIAFTVGDFCAGVDKEIMDAYKKTGSVFEQSGAHVDEVDMGWLKEAQEAHRIILHADAAAFHRQRMVTAPENFGQDVLQRLQIGASLTAVQYADARRVQADVRRRFEKFFDEYDILLTPTTPVAAPLIEGADAVEQARRLTHFTSPFNLAGLPALSLPCGFTGDGLPIGLQIISHALAEASILRAAYAYEQATQWHLRQPGLD